MIVGFTILHIAKDLPDAESLKGVQLKVPLRVYSADGKLISEFGNERRKPIEIDQFPKSLVDAVLATEDDRFYEHNGIDFFGLIRAAISNFRASATQQGASTITMQVARNFFLSREKTYVRKSKELLLALKLEQLFTKQEILSLYLNKIFLGHRAYGFGAAADVYYGKSIEELSVAETAMLAGLPKAPSSINPLRNPERAMQRRNYVLKRLFETKKITSDLYQASILEPITASKHKRGVELSAPHIAEMVRMELIKELGEDAYWQGLNVYTTIQSKQQDLAQLTLRQGLKAYDRRHGFRGKIGSTNLDDISNEIEDVELIYDTILSDYPNSIEQIPALVLSTSKESASVYIKEVGANELSISNSKWAKKFLTTNLVGSSPKSLDKLLQTGDIVYLEKDLDENEQWQLSQIPNVEGALISMEPNTGKIISLVGGYDFFLNKYNRATQSIRQPGSNIKPFIYAAAISKGYKPYSLISGAPIVMTDPTHGTVWRPENYSGKFFGPTRIRSALAQSMNLVSIRLLRSIGIPYTREYLARFGIDMSRFSPTLTMALGSGGITPLEMLTAYSTIANSGYKIEPYFIDYITDRDGSVLYQAKQPEFCDECYLEIINADESETTEINSAQTSANQSTSQNASDEEPNDSDDGESYLAPRVMSHDENFLITSMMKDVITRGTARKALVLERNDLAGKTGTTNDYIDAWFTGFNSQVATTVWVGFDEPETMGRGEAGSVAALPIWVDYMKVALEDVKQDPEIIPDYIVEGYVDRSTGEQADEVDPNSTPEYFVMENLLPAVSKQAKELSMDVNLENIGETEIQENSTERAVDTLPTSQPKIIESTEDTEGLF